MIACRTGETGRSCSRCWKSDPDLPVDGRVGVGNMVDADEPAAFCIVCFWLDHRHVYKGDAKVLVA
jgi:hypothetical protein